MGVMVEFFGLSTGDQKCKGVQHYAQVGSVMSRGISIMPKVQHHAQGVQHHAQGNSASCPGGSTMPRGFSIIPGGQHHAQGVQHHAQGGSIMPKRSNKAKGSSMLGVATCSGGAACPRGAACQGKQHAHGEQHTRSLHSILT